MVVQLMLFPNLFRYLLCVVTDRDVHIAYILSPSLLLPPFILLPLLNLPAAGQKVSNSPLPEGENSRNRAKMRVVKHILVTREEKHKGREGWWGNSYKN